MEMTHEALGQITDAHVHRQDHEDALQPDFGDLLGGDRTEDGADGDADQFGADQDKIHGHLLDHHHVEDVDDHAHQHRQGRGAGHDEHGQTGHRGQEGHVEEAAAHPDEGRDAVDDKTAQQGPEGIEGKFLAIKGKGDPAEAPMGDLDAAGMGSGRHPRRTS